MSLYQLYSHSVEIQYKSYFLSKATLFTFLTTLLNIILPFIVAYGSRGFWLKSHNFYEQPIVHSTFDYLLIASTGDPSEDIICGDALSLNTEKNDENCAEIQIQEYDYNADSKTDIVQYKFVLNLPAKRAITSILFLLALDFQLQTTCDLHMQSIAVIDKHFSSALSEFHYYGDLEFYQISHLPCFKNVVDTRYNTSSFKKLNENYVDIVEVILEDYFKRTVITQVKTLFSRSQSRTTDVLKLHIYLRIPEMQIRYRPSVMQELKWAWPQYFSIVAIFYWIFNRIKKFVFNKRLLMAWKVVPWSKQ